MPFQGEAPGSRNCSSGGKKINGILVNFTLGRKSRKYPDLYIGIGSGLGLGDGIGSAPTLALAPVSFS